jgi:AcrR family transcriptional regulator
LKFLNERVIIFLCRIAAADRYDRVIAKAVTKSNGAWTRSRETRRQILEAAERVLREKGMPGASTREIAREAGVADGTLYVHFHDRVDLFMALIQEHLPAFVEPLKLLPHRAGRRSVKANLAEVLEAFITWHQKLIPVFSAVNADPSLSEALRIRLSERKEGPHLSVAAVERYLELEQQLGRVNPKANPKTIAILLFGAPHYWNSCVHSVGNDLGYSRQALIKDVVDSLFAGLAVSDVRTQGK